MSGNRFFTASTGCVTPLGVRQVPESTGMDEFRSSMRHSGAQTDRSRISGRRQASSHHLVRRRSAISVLRVVHERVMTRHHGKSGGTSAHGIGDRRREEICYFGNRLLFSNYLSNILWRSRSGRWLWFLDHPAGRPAVHRRSLKRIMKPRDADVLGDFPDLCVPGTEAPDQLH